MRIRRRIAGLSATGAAALAVVVGTTPAAQAGTNGADSAQYNCPYKAICVHMHHADQSDWTWKAYYYCGDFYLGSWVPTYYVNNQTPGTRARFKNSSRTVIQTTPGAYSSGSVAYPYATYYVRPC
ncbi:hypothetical protein ACL02U_17080 [Streptomyces sp. MS06]|uniref:hypothetical protein n=1 Tax=Streptomyces sp. MS06 TaxID=3385974 RepID=UPI0039A3E303